MKLQIVYYFSLQSPWAYNAAGDTELLPAAKRSNPMIRATAASKFPCPVATAARIVGLASCLVYLFCLGATGAPAAEPMPDAENGRFALSPVVGGVIRLDTRTGAVSTCTDSGTGWACYATPDERAALDTEIGRLQAENAKLKAELAAREPMVTGKTDERLSKSDALKKADPKVADGERRIEIPLPSDRDVDRAISFLEQAWRRLVEMASRMQKDVSGRI